MVSLRRLYFYGMSLVTALALSWAVSGLLSTFLWSGTPFRGDLRLELAVAAVALLGFLIHWPAARRDAARDGGGACSTERAVFFFAIFSGLMLLMLRPVLGVVNYGFRLLLQSDLRSVLFLRGASLQDALITILVNTVFLIAFAFVYRKDRRLAPGCTVLRDARRSFLVFWMSTGLVLAAVGLGWALANLTEEMIPSLNFQPNDHALALTLLSVGLGLWGWFWHRLKKEAGRQEGQGSGFRRLVLSVVSLLSLLVLLAGVYGIATTLLDWILPPGLARPVLFRNLGLNLALLVPGAIVQKVSSRSLAQEARNGQSTPSADEVTVLFRYLLAGLAWVMLAVGLARLVFLLSALVPGQDLPPTLHEMVSALVLTLLGLAVWSSTMAPLSRAPSASGRGAVMRRGYLLVIIFLCSLGVLVSAGLLLRAQLAGGAPGDSSAFFTPQTIRAAGILGVSLLFLLYHLHLLSRKPGTSVAAGAAQEVGFTAVLVTDEAELGEAFAKAFAERGPQVSLTVVNPQDPLPDPPPAADVLLIPARLAFSPGEPLPAWMAEFPGKRIVLPQADDQWTYLGAPSSATEAVREAARLVRSMAEGGAAPSAVRISTAAVGFAVLAGALAFLLPLVIFLFFLLLTMPMM